MSCPQAEPWLQLNSRICSPPPLSRTGYSSTFWSFVHVFQHRAPSLAGLNAQARTGLDIFKDGRLVFRGNWGGLSVSRDIQSGWVTGRLGMNGRGWDPVGPWWDPVLYNGSQCTPVGPHYWKASHATGSNCQGAHLNSLLGLPMFQNMNF